MGNLTTYASLIRAKLGLDSPSKYVPLLRERCTDPTIQPLLDAFLDENQAQMKLRDGWKQTESARRLFKLNGQQQVQAILLALADIFDEKPRIFLTRPNEAYQHLFRSVSARELVTTLLRKSLPFVEADLLFLLELIAHCHAFGALPIAGLLRAVSNHVNTGGDLSPAMETAVKKLRHELNRSPRRVGRSDIEKLNIAMDRILTPQRQVHVPLDLILGEAWSDAAIADLAAATPELLAKWVDLLLYARTADGTKPTRKWLKSAADRVASLGASQFSQTLSGWLSLLGKPRTQPSPPARDRYSPDPNLLIEESHARILKGLVWCCIGLDSVALARSLGDAGCAAFKKVPMHGPRCVKLANAVVIALSQMPGTEPTAQLGRLSANVKHASARGYVAKGLGTIATRTGQTADDLAELAVPTFGLGPNGQLTRTVGAFSARIQISPAGEVKLQWIRADGKPQKSVPAQLKNEHADGLKELTRTVKDIEKMLPSQRVRVERLLMGRRQWSIADWKNRYAEHPLLHGMTRRLIWEIVDEDQATTAIRREGDFVDADDRVISVREKSQVRLWHPIRSTPQAVLAWRSWLERHAVTQPFKQAHREIYILTEAEIQTATYSNRFAAHILRQHQLAALAQARGWVYRLQGAFDSHNSPTLRLPQHDLRVEYWVEPIEEDETTENGIFQHISTDQVRFFHIDDTNPLNLAQVDPLLFSETMRDVDLFVGVTSIGNDPQWQDAGIDRYGGYWHSISFGELGESSKTRKAVLERLIPRLKIADRCSVGDKFLIVRGDLHAYKIHLGSGNILFGANDQYLCIVPDRSSKAREEIFLPFEGDNTLSTILSKAFLLADDTKIKDPSITMQINRGKM